MGNLDGIRFTVLCAISVIYQLIFVISIFRTQSGLFCEWQLYMVVMSLFSNSDAFQLHISYKASDTSNLLSFINSSEKQFLVAKLLELNMKDEQWLKWKSGSLMTVRLFIWTREPLHAYVYETNTVITTSCNCYLQ